MSNFGAIYLLDHSRLKWLSIGSGVVFLLITAFVYATNDWVGNSRYLLLIPLTTGVALIAAGATLRLQALRMFWLLWFVVLPGAFWAVNVAGCGLGLFTKSWCA
jgi:hypothetical protein